MENGSLELRKIKYGNTDKICENGNTEFYNIDTFGRTRPYSIYNKRSLALILRMSIQTFVLRVKMKNKCVLAHA